MMIKKVITGITMLALFSVMVVAQTTHEPRAEQMAKELLEKASAKIKSFRSMEVAFTYTMENTAMEVNESYTGKLVSKGDKYRMTLGDNVFISDGQTVWNYLDDLYEIHINYVENMEGGLTPTALLENFGDEYKSRFVKQETYKGKTVDIIDLVPNAPQSFFKYRVALDASDHMILYTIAYDRHGGTYTYSLDRTSVNQNISDDLFVFKRTDFPANVDIIDLR